MKTILQANVQVWEIGIMLELAVWDKRPELQRICKMVGSDGRINEAIVNSALPGLSESAQRNVLRSLEHMRLVEGGALTQFGRRCGDSGDAPSWELGAYSLLVAQHPCFGAWPMAFKREKPDGFDREFGNLQEVPAWLQPMSKNVWTCAIEGKRFTIYDFPGLAGQPRPCRVVEKPPARLTWDLDLTTGKNAYRIEGEVLGEQGRLQRFRTFDAAVPDTEVLAMFAAWEPRWNATTERVLLSYDGGASKDGHDDFIRTRTYTKVKAGARGTFDSAKVEGVPVGPVGATEARAWATALALSRVNAADAYVAPDGWAKHWDQTVSGTPLAPKAAAAPDLFMLLDQQTALSPRLRWLLAAAADLVIE